MPELDISNVDDFLDQYEPPVKEDVDSFLDQYRPVMERPTVQTAFIEDSNSVVSAPRALTPEQIVYHNDIQNNNQDPSTFFGYTKIAGDTALNVVKGYVRGVGSMGKRYAQFEERTAELGIESAEKRQEAAWTDLFTALLPTGRGKVAGARIEEFFGKEGALESVVSDLIKDKSVSKDVVKQYDVILDNMGLKKAGDHPVSNFGFDVGAGAQSFVEMVGVSAILKNPLVMVEYIAEMQKGDNYQEARAKGFDPSYANSTAEMRSYASGAVNLVGLKVLGNWVAASKPMQGMALGVLNESFEEGFETGIDIGITQLTGITNLTFKQGVGRVLYSSLIGAVIGAPASVMVSMTQQIAKEENINPDLAKKIQEKIQSKEKEISKIVEDALFEEVDNLNDNKENIKKSMELAEAFANGQEITSDGKIVSERAQPAVSQKQEIKGDAVKLTAEDMAKAELDNVRNTEKEQIGGRVKKIKEDSDNINKQLDLLEEKYISHLNEGKPTKQIEKQINKLVEQNDTLVDEMNILEEDGSLKIAETGLKSKDIIMKAGRLDKIEIRAAKERASAVKRGFKEGSNAAKTSIKNAQKILKDTVKKAGLNEEEFIAEIKTINEENIKTKLPKIEQKVINIIEKKRRSDAISKLKKIAKTASKSQLIAADFSTNILDTISGIELRKPNQKTRASLEATKEYFDRTKDPDVPIKVLKKLDRLNKKPVKEITTEDLESLVDDLQEAIAIGKTKQRMKEAAKKRRFQARLNAMDGQIVPIASRDIKRKGLGQQLHFMDALANTFNAAMNRVRELHLIKNPLDVFFDIVDGTKDYKGAAFKTFKEPVDKAWGGYTNLKDNVVNPVLDLADRLKLDDSSFEKIGVYAALAQESGEEKLLATGITQEELDALVLTDNEMKMYTLMRQMLDSMYPAVRRTMIDVYNKDVTQESDYFPFLIDFDAIAENNVNIEDSFGSMAPLVSSAGGVKSKRKNAERGFTKERVGGGKPIKINALSVFLNHVDNAAYLVEMGQTVKELGDLAASEEFGEIAGDITQGIVTDWIARVARNGRDRTKVAILDTLRRNTGFAVLGFKLSTVVLQPTALLDGAALVGGDYVSQGVYNFSASKEWRLFLKDNFPEIRKRVGDDAEYMELGGNKVVKNIREAGYYAIKKVDLFAAGSVAIGAYTRAVEAKGQKVDFNNPDQDAIVEAQLYMRRSQNSAFAKDSPLLLSDKGLTKNASVNKLIFQFQSFLLNRWATIENDVVRAGIKGRTAQSLNAATFLLLAVSAEIAARDLSKDLMSYLLTGEEDDDDEEYINKYAKTMLGNIPFISSAMSFLQYGSNPIPTFSLLGSSGQEIVYANRSKDENKKLKHEIGAGLLFSGLLGVPAAVQAEQIQMKLMGDGKETKGKKVKGRRKD